MTEYIGREQALYELCNNSTPVFDGDGHASFVGDYIAVLNSIPAADVVEVVRCKDCAVPHNHWTGCPRMNGTIMRPDDYCSYGERKEVQG